LIRGFLAKNGFIDESPDGVHENLRLQTKAALSVQRSVVIGEDHDTSNGSYLTSELNTRQLRSNFSHEANEIVGVTILEADLH